MDGTDRSAAGYYPGRLLLVVAGPAHGHCTKAVAALLPGRWL